MCRKLNHGLWLVAGNQYIFLSGLKLSMYVSKRVNKLSLFTEPFLKNMYIAVITSEVTEHSDV